MTMTIPELIKRWRQEAAIRKVNSFDGLIAWNRGDEQEVCANELEVAWKEFFAKNAIDFAASLDKQKGGE